MFDISRSGSHVLPAFRVEDIVWPFNNVVKIDSNGILRDFEGEKRGYPFFSLNYRRNTIRIWH